MKNIKIFKFLFSGIIVVLTLSHAPQGKAHDFPLKVSNNKRYLVDQKNVPFFWAGDSAWSLIVQLSKEDAIYYLEDRKKKGFNVLLVNLIDRKYCNNPPTNYYEELPFTGKVFTTPNEEYFIHADYVINEAAKRGIIILLCPLYLGYLCGQDGWCLDVKKASIEDMHTWGQYLGNRYKNYDNIVWCIGGDADPNQVKDKVLQCINGIRETDSRHLFTSHNHPESYAITPWPSESWQTINNIYSYSTTLYQESKTAYRHSPIMPFFLLESAYENEHNSSQQRLRSQAYWAVLSGGFGQIFGNCPIWHFDSTPEWCGISGWKSQLDSPGSLSMIYLHKLFKSRAWNLLIPDFSHEVMVGGYGFLDELFNTEDYVTAAITTNGNTMIAYLPSNRRVTIDMSKISGTHANCWWYKPSDGSVIEIGSYMTSHTQQFSPPSSGDWVIVIDDSSLELPAPGQSIYQQD